MEAFTGNLLSLSNVKKKTIVGLLILGLIFNSYSLTFCFVCFMQLVRKYDQPIC